ncbi:dynein axonemal heavy chain 14 [Gastrophryne carolinensis]
MSGSERRVTPGTALISRLHFGAEKSDVLQMISRNAAMHKQAGSPNERRMHWTGVNNPEDTEEEAMKSGESEKRTPRTRSDASRFPGGQLPHPQGYLRIDTYQDNTADDSVMLHIQRLRAGLGWKTPLPSDQQVSRLSKPTKYKLLMEEQRPIREDSGEFVYCLPRCCDEPSARYDPYDLQVVPAWAAMKRALYWTVSASQVSKIYMVNRAEIMETVPLTDWLLEREKYYAIQSMRLFFQFRALLLQQLFTADELFQDCLLYLQSLCEGAISIQHANQGEDFPVPLIKVDASHTYSLKEFCDIQSGHCDSALARLQALRGRVIPVIHQTFIKVTEAAGLKEMFLSSLPGKPNYSQLSDWRSLRERFQRFLTLVDCMFQETLRYVVTNSVDILVKFMDESDNVTATEEKKNEQFRDNEEKKLYDTKISKQSFGPDSTQTPLTSDMKVVKSMNAKPQLQINLLEDTNGLEAKALPIEAKALPIEAKALPIEAAAPLIEAAAPPTEATPPIKAATLPIKAAALHIEAAALPIEAAALPIEAKALPIEAKALPIEAKALPIEAAAPPTEATPPIKAAALPIKAAALPIKAAALHIKAAAPPIEAAAPPIDAAAPSIESATPPIDATVLLIEAAALPKEAAALPKEAAALPIEAAALPIEAAALPIEAAALLIEATAPPIDATPPIEATAPPIEFETERHPLYSEEWEEDAEEDEHYSGSARPVTKKVCVFPSKNDFDLHIRAIVDGFEHTIGKMSLSLEPCFSNFGFPVSPETKASPEKKLSQRNGQKIWPNCDLLLGKDEHYKKQVKKIFLIVRLSMEKVEAYSGHFAKFCSMVETAENVKSRITGNQAELMPEEYRNILARFKGFISECKQMNVERRVGAVKVQSSEFQEACLQHLQSVVDIIHTSLPAMAYAKNVQLLEVIHKSLQRLNLVLSNVEDFVEHLTFLSQISSDLTSLERKYNAVIQLYSLAKDYGISIPSEEVALYQSLIPSFQQLKSAVLYCEAKKDEDIVKFSGDLDKYISNLHFELMDFKIKVRNPILLEPDTFPLEAKEIINTLLEEYEVVANKAQCYSSYQERFGSSITHMKAKLVDVLLAQRTAGEIVTTKMLNTELSEIESDLNLRRLLWEAKEEWTSLSMEWRLTPFDSLDVDMIQRDVNRFSHTIFMLEKGLPPNDVVTSLKQSILDFKQSLPIVVALRNPCLQTRHWDAIHFTIGRMITKDKNFTLGNLLELRIFQHKDKIIDISTTATNEATLEGMLNKIISLWNKTEFKLTAHQSELSEILIIASAEDIMTQLEESQVILSTVKGSRYCGPIKSIVDEWDRKLNLFNRTIEEWMMCQRNWLYLEQIFLASDIQRQLPAEAKLFAQVDSSWKELMNHTKDRPNALRAATAPGVLEILQTNNAHLEKILKCLEDFLEIKRRVFPRFYFLSNNDLLAILAECKNPNVVQPHLAKCFENIRHLDIKYPIKSPPEVEMIISAEGEMIRMPKNVRVRGPVEQWLGNVETGMFDVVKRLVRAGVQDWGQSDFKKWMLTHPGQVVLVVSQIMFNKDCIRGFSAAEPEKELRTVLSNLVNQLHELADMALEIPLPHQKTTLEALLTIYVHCRDVLTQMINNKIFALDDFEWTRQLRYEWNDQNNSCYVVQGNASFIYGYEYLGCSSRLVITPLTDRCWLTLTGALDLHLGGSPAGPAGTGKTETVKDLAKALGKQCVVFNCSEGLDYKMMGKFFSGMAQSGAWCCFDEFNRIDVEVLSVIASQVHAIKTAKDSQAIRFMFEGREIRLNMSCGIFITMNPGYKGRVELPDNLKSLFRPVSMMVPDYQLIAEIMLFSEGFKAAKSLSGKLVNLYQLASKQLSQQNHYDFGMRAIKTVLVVAGQKKHDLESREKKTRLSSEDEALIIITALREANLPKFLAEDVPLFESIMSDLFPGVIFEKVNTKRLENAISVATKELGLQPWESQTEKVIQFYNQIVARHGVMLVGPTGGGKTTVRRILERALLHLPSNSKASCSSLKGKVETFIINPKCVTLGELYGEINLNTMEWSDGLLAYAVRNFTQKASKDGGATPASSPTAHHNESNAESLHGGPKFMELNTEDDRSDKTTSQSKNVLVVRSGEAASDWFWIILDGPVDTMWVENLNTVLDDTRTLCLANSERIRLPESMRMIFEVDSLAQASPATVSRCAMVYMDPVDLGWRPFVKTWVTQVATKLPPSGAQYLDTMFSLSVDEGIKFIRRHRNCLPFPVQDMVLVMNLCKILEAFIDFISRNGGFGRNEMEENLASLSNAQETCSASDTGRSYTPSLSTSSKRREEQKWFLEKHPEKLTQLLGKLYIFAFTWAFGGVLNREDEQEGDSLIGLKARDESLANITYDFSSFVHDLFEGEQARGVQMPLGESSIFSYFVDLQTGNFVPWDSLVPSTESLIQKETLLFSELNPSGARESSVPLFISTIDSVRYSFLSSLLLLAKHPVLLTGDSGVGKSTLIHNMLEKLQKPGGLSVKAGTVLGDVFLFNDSRTISLLKNLTSMTAGDEDLGLTPDDIEGSLVGVSDGRESVSDFGFRRLNRLMVSNVQLGAHSSPATIQSQILSKLVKRGRDTLGAPKSKQVAVFIDDLNMPIPEQYGAQPPLELIRQFLELGGFYDTKALTWKTIQNVSLIAACAPPGGGRNEISPRLLKHFCMFSLPHPSVQALQHIFQVQLGSFLLNQNFLADIQKCRELLSSCAIAIYYRTCHSLLPTPAKCHYTFNLRDLFKVLRGLLQASESVIVTKEMATQLLIHEATRVFCDRLVDQRDREIFFQCLSDELHNYFKVSWSKEKLMSDPIQFVDFLDASSSTKSRVYRPITNQKQLVSKLEEYRMKIRMNSASAADAYVFFPEAIQHVIRAARVFRQPGGHMMLVGLDGTGKVSSAALACYIAECKLIRLSISQSYSHMEFRDDLKKVYKEAGLLGNSVVLLIRGSDIIKDSFLEDINSILNSGEVPDLFDKEELDGLFVELKSEAVEANMSDSAQSMLAFFLQRVRSKLHIVLALSPAGQTFRDQCRSHPSLVNCCTIDWYDEWPEEALCSVVNRYVTEHDLLHTSQNLQDGIAQVCVAIHKGVTSKAEQYLKESRRHFYITPQSYLSFIDTFSNILQTKRQKLTTDRNRFFTGLSKLLEATSSIEVMQHELVSLGPQIEQKSKEIEELMAKLQRDSAVVEQVREIVKQDEEVMAQETRIVEEYAEQAQRELSEVLPALAEAVSALDSLDKSDISEVKVYTNPPFLVLTVMNAVCVLLQKKPDWTTAKLLLGDPGFLKRLVSLDKDQVPEKVFIHLKKYTTIPDFNPQKVGIVSTACRSLCQWVLALEHYHEVHKMVTPKQHRVAEAQEALKLAQGRLKQKQDSLSLVEDHQQLLEKQYNDSIAEKDQLAYRRQLTTKRLARASVLITALDEEKVRWKESVDWLDQRLEGIIGDSLVSAAFIAYCGVFTSEYRVQLLEQWLALCGTYQIPVSADYSIIRVMARKSEVRKWRNEGLPPDPYSTENAILVKNGRRWPLLIDPHGQAYKWISQMEGGRLRQVQASEPSCMKTLENAIRLGEPILLQDIPEDLDPSLKSILGKEIYCRAGQDFIRLGDSEIEYNQNFRLYMSTQNPNPHFLPAVCISVTLISFTVTLKGLQDQLLSIVVTHEQPHLEVQRNQLLENISSDLSTLRELEERSLTLLQKTEGHLLDDEDLIHTLQKSKLTSKDILKRMEASGKTEETIEAARGIYLPVAHRGAVLYFVVADLIHLNYMYQFSLQWFHTVFVESMKSLKSQPNQEKSEDIERHLYNICDTLTRNVYKIVTLSLFTEHKLCFSLLLTVNIMKNSSEESPGVLGFLPQAEWDFFLHSLLLSNFMGKGGSQEDKESADEAAAQHIPQWLSGSVWRQCQYLSHHLDPFSSLCDSLSSGTQQWREFCNSDNPYEILKKTYNPSREGMRQGSDIVGTSEEQVPPAEVLFHWEKLTSFQKLILIKILRPECLTNAIREFIAEKMGSEYIQSSAVNLKQALEESSNTSPLIFILSSGSDPVGELERLALEMRGSTLHLDMISLGRGQGVKAEELINKAKRITGHWVFLQNCHLAASFMPRLREIVESFEQQSHSMDLQFRLWLSSRPDQLFPVSILQKGFKIAVEPPRGLKGKLLQTFDTSGTGLITEKMFEKENQGRCWKKLLFSLCLFHAVLNERRKYGALGWNIPYEFTSSDLEVSVQTLAMLSEGREEIPWKAGRYLTGEVVYGGRVTDHWDRRCLLSIMDAFYDPAVLQEDYCFSADKVYRTLAEDITFWECREYIASLPDSDTPHIFGMHAHADRAYGISQAELLVDTIVSMQPRLHTEQVSDRGDSGRDELVLDMASAILTKLPLTVEGRTQQGKMEQDKLAAMTVPITTLGSLFTDPAWEKLVKSTTGYDSLVNSAMLNVLHQEIHRFNRLLSVIHGSLHALCQAVRGEIILNKGLEEVYSSLAGLKVPELWQRRSYESCKALGSWVDDLVQRIGFFSAWSGHVITCVHHRFGEQLGLKKTFKYSRPNSSQPPDALQATKPPVREEPHSYWLPAFFFPQGFLMAVLQNHARQRGVSVDSLTFKHQVQPMQTPALDVAGKPDITDVAFNGSRAPGEGVLVFGLFLDGARWSSETRVLEECEHQQRFYPLPQIHFLPHKVEASSSRSDEDGATHIYECPLYRTPLRAGTLSSTGHSTNFVTAVTLPTLLTPEHWIRRGVALLCQITQ